MVSSDEQLGCQKNQSCTRFYSRESFRDTATKNVTFGFGIYYTPQTKFVQL